MQITLHNQDVVTLRDPDLISERHRRQVEAAYLELDDDSFKEFVSAAEEDREVQKARISAKDLAFMAKVNDVCILALVQRWQRGEQDIVPSVDTLLDLDAQSYADLGGSAAPLISEIRLDFDPTPAGVESPTDPSGA